MEEGIGWRAFCVIHDAGCVMQVKDTSLIRNGYNHEAHEERDEHEGHEEKKRGQVSTFDKCRVGLVNGMFNVET
jgi:hypothetical protein